MTPLTKENIKTLNVILVLAVASFLFVVFASNFIDNKPNDTRYVESLDGASVNAQDFTTQFVDGQIAQVKGGSTSQAFSFLSGGETKNGQVTNFKYLDAVGTVFLKPFDTPVRTTASFCPTGSAVRFLECSGDASSYNCNIDMFGDLWYKQSSAETIDLNSFAHLKNKEFRYTYVCYDYNQDSPAYSTKTSFYIQSCYASGEVKGLSGVVEFDTEAQCNDYKIAQTTNVNDGRIPVTHTDFSGGDIGSYGVFSGHTFANEITQFDSIRISGQFKASRDIPVLYLEGGIDPNTKTQALSVIDIQSSQSGCDSSNFFAGKFVYDVKKGDVINYKFNSLAPSEAGEYTIYLIAKRGCWKDVGSEPDDVYVSDTILVNKDTSRDGASNDWDNDGFVNLKDNCPSHANPTQSDIDKDGIGDACDVCKTNKGIAEFFGCHPCINLPESSICWQDVAKNYPQENIGDLRLQWGNADDLYSAWLKEKEAQAQKFKTQEIALCGFSGCLSGDRKDFVCSGDESVSETCEDGTTIISQICKDNVFVAYQDCSGNTLPDKVAGKDKSFISTYATELSALGVVGVLTLVAVFLI